MGYPVNLEGSVGYFLCGLIDGLSQKYHILCLRVYTHSSMYLPSKGLHGLTAHDEATETLSQYGYHCIPFSGYNPQSKRIIQSGIFVASLLPVVQWDFDYFDEKKQWGILSVLVKMEGLYSQQPKFFVFSFGRN